jgi:hypothetical protein
MILLTGSFFSSAALSSPPNSKSSKAPTHWQLLFICCTVFTSQLQVSTSSYSLAASFHLLHCFHHPTPSLHKLLLTGSFFSSAALLTTQLQTFICSYFITATSDSFSPSAVLLTTQLQTFICSYFITATTGSFSPSAALSSLPTPSLHMLLLTGSFSPSAALSSLPTSNLHMLLLHHRHLWQLLTICCTVFTTHLHASYALAHCHSYHRCHHHFQL